MGLKEGVKLSTLTTCAHIGNLSNKRDHVEGVEMQGQCIFVLLVS
jgi:hypothetical protein